ncbi:glutamine synthetase [Gongronella butleri]|nr:glutamine synthetase [Gongronella butleri]
MAAIKSNPSILNKYLQLDQGDRFQVEYLWIDGYGEIRSKTRTLTAEQVARVDCVPEWNFDGSSTGQSDGHDSDILLQPVAMYHDPFRRRNDGQTNKLVLCETYLPDGSPHPSNQRYACAKVMATYADEKPWFGIEQEYMFFDVEKDRPYGWPSFGHPEPQGKYYCGVGASKVYGRDMVEAHYKACLFAGITIAGANVENVPGQFEYQIGPCEGIAMGDELWVARYLMERVAEDFGVGITIHPKPVSGDWNGAGAHCNYSTQAMREDGGMEVIEAAIEKMGLRHFEHIAVYGEDNDMRLLGNYETAHIGAFCWGIANRGASIRIPRHVSKAGKGYMEDRRPASNIDPYPVTSIIVESSLSPLPARYHHI